MSKFSKKECLSFLNVRNLKLTYRNLSLDVNNKSYYTTVLEGKYSTKTLKYSRKPTKIIFFIKNKDNPDKIDEIEFDYKKFKNFTNRNNKINRINESSI